MKIKDSILHYTLTAAVTLSICLSALLWVNPTYLQNTTRNDTNTAKNKQGSADTAKSRISDVYQPTIIIYNKNGQSFKQASLKLDLTENMRQDIQTWQVKRVGAVKRYAKKDYQTFLQQEQMMLLAFPDEIAPGQLADMLTIPEHALTGRKFNRIAVRLTQHPKVYLLNDNNFQVTQLHLKKGQFKNLRAMVRSKDVTQTPVEIKNLNGKYISFYTNHVKVQQYSYLANKDSANTFVTRLLGNTNSSVNSRKEDKETVYYDNSGQRLTVENETGLIHYSNYSHDTSDNETLSKDLTQGFAHLQETGRLLDDVRYDEYNSNEHQVIYRTYINAFPILADNNYGTYHIKLAGTTGERLDFSLYSLQIPVPAKQRTTDLPPTQQVWDQLVKSGISPAKMKSIRVGYRAEVNHSTKQVIDLVPTYFVLYNGSWVDSQKMLTGEISE